MLAIQPLQGFALSKRRWWLLRQLMWFPHINLQTCTHQREQNDSRRPCSNVPSLHFANAPGPGLRVEAEVPARWSSSRPPALSEQRGAVASPAPASANILR